MSEFKIGDKVIERQKIIGKYSHPIGTILTFDPDGRLIIEWGHTGSNYLSAHTPDECVSEEEGKGISAAMLAAESRLAAEFEASREKFESKIAEATRLVKDARKIAKACGKDFRSLKKELQPLFNTLKEYGWSQSTMNC